MSNALTLVYGFVVNIGRPKSWVTYLPTYLPTDWMTLFYSGLATENHILTPFSLFVFFYSFQFFSFPFLFFFCILFSLPFLLFLPKPFTPPSLPGRSTAHCNRIKRSGSERLSPLQSHWSAFPLYVSRADVPLAMYCLEPFCSFFLVMLLCFYLTANNQAKWSDQVQEHYGMVMRGEEEKSNTITKEAALAMIVMCDLS